jgi:hypothetical protein
MHMYKLLEIVSSVFGLVVVIVWTCYWYRTTNASVDTPAEAEDGPWRRSFMHVLSALTVLGALLRAYHANGIHLGIRPLVYFTLDFLLSAIAFFLLGLLAYGVILRRQKATYVRKSSV